MTKNRIFRGFYHSEDGIITKVMEADETSVTFQAAFAIPRHLLTQFKEHPEFLIFSERSRIARLGVMITSETPQRHGFKDDQLILTLKAMSVIPDYPDFCKLKPFFSTGLKIGRLAYCDPRMLLTANDVLSAVNASEMKLPASTSISSSGNILIAPHNVIYKMNRELDRDTLGRILLRKDGRELLNLFQSRQEVDRLIIPPGQGIITTCSMYLNHHFVVLENDKEQFSGLVSGLGYHLPATILDPIKTRGINIFLEIINRSDQPIVNPLIPAKIYQAKRAFDTAENFAYEEKNRFFSFSNLKEIENRFNTLSKTTCNHLNKPAALMRSSLSEDSKFDVTAVDVFENGPETVCENTLSICASERRNFSLKSRCAHAYAVTKMNFENYDAPTSVVMKYFPNLREHFQIIEAASKGDVDALYFFEPSYEHGPFLSQQDHHRLQEYFAFGLKVYWISSLSNRLMMYTERDGMGYFVLPDKLTAFHTSMLFAFYGSNKFLSEAGNNRLSNLIESLIQFWGKNIGFVTGGGSGVMEMANVLARKNGILSGANYLEITDQPITTDMDFCQIFQSSCRHSRQKWFEVTSFPVFNIGGLGTLEELGISLCNMKLSISQQVPIVLFDTENSGYWQGVKDQVITMAETGRAPAWAKDVLVLTNDPAEVIDAYRKYLRLF